MTSSVLALDQLTIERIHVRAIVGVYDEERREKRDLFITVTLWTDLKRAGISDQLEDTIDYGAIEREVVASVDGMKPRLIETIAEEAARIALRDPRVSRAEVLVEKPGCLPHAKSATVKVARGRP